MAPKPSPVSVARTGVTPRPPAKRTDAHPLDRGQKAEAQRPETPPAPAVPEPGVATAPVAGTGAPDTPPTVASVQGTPASERRQLNVGVPKDLKLHRRAGLYAEDHGLSRQDQVALALDAWLRERGY
ncbi:hypothetical protein ABZ249_31455 [Nocardiopsis sp. NPDC006139]|uniref:hypothetical protein n=1 Tax=Nocardiopsis sp. NPDC006139 TaxID=3154578 RepID=UPI0033BBC123